MMIFLNMNIDFTRINDNKLPLIVINNFYSFLWFVNTSNKFKCNFVLEINSKMSEKENTFFYNSHISFKNKLIFQCRINII